MRKAYSTKQPRPVPAEYEQSFVRLGHSACQQMFGKRAAQRYFLASGPSRLRQMRDLYLAAAKAVTSGCAMGQGAPS
jgi:hypothetical protein